MLCYRPSLGWATSAISTYTAVRSFTCLVPAKLTPCGFSVSALGADMWVGTLQHKGAVRSLAGMEFIPGQKSCFLVGWGIPVLLLHMCSTSWESSGLAPQATLTFLSKDNKLGWVIRSKLVLRLRYISFRENSGFYES